MYRAFNKEVGEKRYNEIRSEVKTILKGLKLELNKNSWVEEWGKVTQKQWKQLLNISEAKDFKEGFEYISGRKIDEDPMITLPDGRKFSASTIQEALKKYVNE